MDLKAARSCSLLPDVTRAHAPFRPAARGRPLITCSAERQPRREVFPGQAAQHLAAALLAAAVSCGACQPAAAVLNSPNASIARTVDAALRRAIPATNPDVKAVQRYLEDIAFKLRIPQRKPWAQMSEDVVRATKLMYDDAKVFAGVPAGQEPRARELAEAVRAQLVRVNAAIEAKDADKVSIRTAACLESVAALELVEAPGLAFSIPAAYQQLPRLTGRAIVQLTFERPGDDAAFVGREGFGGKPLAAVTLELDGYSAPLTAGNFAANVLGGAYDGAQLAVGGETISLASSNEKLKGRVLPMEILPLGEFEPLYKTPLDVQGGELPVLPLSIYGAVAMAHPPGDAGDAFAAANEFFVYKFEKASSGLAGLSFEEGQFPVFGYVTEGLDFLAQLQSGDRLVKAELTSGAERLTVPSAQS